MQTPTLTNQSANCHSFIMSDQQQETIATPKKGITFNNRVTVRRTIHIADFTNEEIDACWYSYMEYSNIRRHVQETILLAEHEIISEARDCQTYCCRGLEGFTSEGMEGRRRRRNNAKMAVFDEQDRQFEAGKEMDGDEIARLYRRRCRSSRNISLLIGLVGEQVASCKGVPPVSLDDLFSVVSNAQRLKVTPEIKVHGKTMNSTPMPNTQVFPQPSVATRMVSSAA